MQGKPGAKGKQGMPGGKGMGGCMALTGLQGVLPLPLPVMVVKQDPLGLEARSHCTAQHTHTVLQQSRSVKLDSRVVLCRPDCKQ